MFCAPFDLKNVDIENKLKEKLFNDAIVKEKVMLEENKNKV